MGDEVKEAWGDWIAELREWDLFGGLTFDPKRFRWEGAPTREYVVRRLERWIRRAEGRLKRKVQYVTAMEYHKSGWPHLHPLLDVGGLGADTALSLRRLWEEENGFARLKPPSSGVAVCRYAAKYLAKDFGSGDVFLSAGIASGDSDRKAVLVGREGGRSVWRV